VLNITNVDPPPPGGATAMSVPLHPKDPAMGDRPMRIGPHVLLEATDAAECTVGENITLMRWGVVTVTAGHKDASGQVRAAVAAVVHFVSLLH
jgi:tRNA synthetases class I (E and Q), anti-codon binding domain